MTTKVKKTNEKTKKKAKAQKAEANVEFDDQSFLWDFIDTFKNIDWFY